MRLSQAAEDDLRKIFTATREEFGASALIRYQALVRVGLESLAEDPIRPGSSGREEFGRGVRSYHLQHCRKRARVEGRTVRRPRHLIVYSATDLELTVLRVLHDAIELTCHLPPPD